MLRVADGDVADVGFEGDGGDVEVEAAVAGGDGGGEGDAGSGAAGDFLLADAEWDGDDLDWVKAEAEG